MASPDVTPYVDLRILDQDPQDIFDNAKAALAISLPAWVPRETAVETLLLEALALEVSEARYAVNRLPSAIFEILLRLYGLTRSAGTPPTASLVFHMIGTAGYSIPAGTECRLTLPGDADPIIFTTDSQLDISPGSATGTVTATGDRYTSEANGTAEDTVVELLDSIITVDFVDLGAEITDGEDPETDTDYFDRGAARLARLSDTLVLPRHFTAAALEYTYVERAHTVDNWDADTGNDPGTVPGHVTVAVYGDGAEVSGGNKSALEAALTEICHTALTVHVIDPDVTAQDVTATVKGLPGYTSAELEANVEAALQAYLSPATWDWSSTIRRLKLIAVITEAEGVDYVVSMTTPAADVTLTGDADLVECGTLTITGTEA